MPAHMPYGHPGQAYGGYAVLFGTQTVLNIIELDKHGESKTDVLNGVSGNKAEPPAIKI